MNPSRFQMNIQTFVCRVYIFECTSMGALRFQLILQRDGEWCGRREERGAGCGGRQRAGEEPTEESEGWGKWVHGINLDGDAWDEGHIRTGNWCYFSRQCKGPEKMRKAGNQLEIVIEFYRNAKNFSRE